jgi:dipeptidyl aminopeptidase/acylaminoacyl peptidase
MSFRPVSTLVLCENRLVGKSFLFCVLAISSLFGADSIEHYLNAPFASDLLAAPSGGKVVWILDEHGARNLWVAAAPDYKGRRLTSYSEDDGQEIGDVAWSVDGRFLVYARGGDFDTNGDVPNPRNLAQPPEQAIYTIPFDGGAPKRLSDGRGPVVSRDGHVAFVKNSQIWMTTLDAEKTGEKPLEAVRTKASTYDLQWSPDGAALAFTSYRGDHSFIGVYRVATKAVSYVDPSVDRDTSPIWSPDGRRIAFLRQAYSSASSVGPRRETANPWSIRVVDAATGMGREAWHAEKGPGSVFRGIEAQTQLFWADGNRLVFPWERDGWVHLYSVSAEGGPAQNLTPGDFEIEHVSLSRDRREVLFSSNQNDIDRRHVWRVPASGGNPSPLLSAILGDGIEWNPEDVGGGAITFLRSSATEISRAAVKIGNGIRDLAPDSIPADFPKDLVKPQQVIFPASDGMSIHGQLFLPPPGGAIKHAAVVFFHGGPRRQMLLGYHYRRYYSNAYAMNQYLAARGFIVLSVNYRSGIGYGLNFREALNSGNSGGSDVSDVIGAGVYMAGRPDVDSRRIGVWGGSYGGYLTAMALARASTLFTAGVDMHGVEDWSIRGERTLTPLNADELRDIERTALQSSPLGDVKNWRSPVLLIHGDDDRNVAFNQTVRLVEALRAQGVEFEELIFPGEVHEFLLEESWIKAYRAAGEFLARKLKPE